MKLMTLNIWGGHVHEPLLKFIAEHQDIDIFCFQEVYYQANKKISDDDRLVYLNILGEFETLLPQHVIYFRPTVNKNYGIAIMIKKEIDVLAEGEIEIYTNPDYPGHGPSHSRNLQWLEFKDHNKIYSIINLHGLWNGQGKADSIDRIKQSKRVKDFMDGLKAPKILCGDFNLRPDTESLKILEEGMNNLISLNQIQSTRTSYYQKPEKFADYILTSPGIQINHFEVLKDEVSDHTPLFLDFS